MLELFIFTSMQSFFKSNMVFKSARKTRSHPGREAPMLTPTTPLLLCPQAPKVLHFTYLAIDLCPCLLTCSCALEPTPLPSHLCPCPLTYAHARSPVSGPSYRCVYLLTCTPTFSSSSLCSCSLTCIPAFHLCSVLLPNPQCGFFCTFQEE